MDACAIVSIMLVSRYAPSPTGPLHLGNLRTALLAWLQARLAGAAFVLRMEDLDTPRVKTGSAGQIMNDLRWLGLEWDQGPCADGKIDGHYQSCRTHLYRQAMQTLYDKGRIYPCYCSRKDIREAASAPHGPTPLYPGSCRDKYPDVAPSNEKTINHRSPAWRFRVDDQTLNFTDTIQGLYSQNLGQDVGDFVIRRSDGLFAYQLAVVVDDIAMQVTDVLRGVDLLDSTCRQIALYQALGQPIPRYWHVALMNDEAGKRMSKRDGADSLAQIKVHYGDPESVIGLLAASCGLIERDRALSAHDLLHELDLEIFTRRLRQHSAQAR